MCHSEERYYPFAAMIHRQATKNLRSGLTRETLRRFIEHEWFWMISDAPQSDTKEGDDGH